MIYSRLKICATFLLIFVLAINIVSIDARKFGSSRSSGRVSRPRTPVHIPKTPVFVPKPPSRPPPRQPAPSGPIFPQPHTPHNSGSTQAKDSSNILIHSEGGGRPRPGATVNDHKQQSSPHQPSAPYEPANKINVGQVQSQGPNHGASSSSGGYPPWANPSMNQHGSSSPHVPYPSAPHNSPHGTSYPNSQSKPGPLTSAPYPPTHPAGPISHQPINPSHQQNQNSGMPMPHPNSYPYPNAPHGMQSPSQHIPPAPYPSSHPQGMPMPSAPHIGFGNNNAHTGVHQPIGAPHNYQPVGTSPMQPHNGYSQPTVIHNHYNGPPVGSPQNPAGHPVYGHQPVYGGAPMGQPFVPGQTVVVLPNQQPHDNGRGLGQIFKEALVFSTVNAGVNRILNGPSHHHQDSYPSGQPAAAGTPTSSTSTVTNTVIYNNQYGNPVPGANPLPGGNPVPGVNPTPGQGITGQPGIPPTGSPGSYPPAGATGGISNSPTGNVPTPGSNNPLPNYGDPGSSSTSGPQYQNSDPQRNSAGNTIVHASSGTTNNTNNQNAAPVQEFQYFISNEELWNLTESLFAKDEINASRYVTHNLQKRSNDPNATDQSPGPLLYVRDEAYALPTVQAIRDIYDNYEFDSEKKEIMDSNKRRQENAFLDTFMNTNIMTTAMNWLATKGYIETDDFEWKDTIRHIWMSKVNGATSGFERIFMAEKYPGPSVLGAQNWIYFDSQELLRRVNYLSYSEKVHLGDKATLVKINFKIDDVFKPNTTMLIGTPPELEMALYTICYYTRPNDLCTVSLGGTKLNFYTHSFRYFGKDLIDLGLMFF